MNQPMLYAFSSVSITAGLFLLIMVGNEIGFRIGRFVQARTDEEIKSLTGAIQASVLGLLALLLGFTFSMSMQRFDARNHALISEANAIGTAQLRAQLLPERFQQETSSLLEAYLESRVAAGKVELTAFEDRKAYNREIARLQAELWTLAVNAAHEEPSPVKTGAFINALNEMIDAQGKRNALLDMHVPEVVLLLLFTVFMCSGGMLGYSSGLSGRRIVAPTLMMSFLIALIVFIIIDLDRPRRGLIQVDQRSLEMLLSQSSDGRQLRLEE